MSRRIVWFSCGAASAVAARLTIAEHGRGGTHLVYTDPGSEHPDNVRFRAAVEEWLGHPVEVLRSERYADTWDVWEQRRFLNGPTGALCTTELKKKLRYAYQLPTDIQVFGYTSEERHRADRFRGLRDSEDSGVDESGCDDRPDVVTRRSIPLYLDELDPDRGSHADEPSFECSLLCHLAEDEGDAA